MKKTIALLMMISLFQGESFSQNVNLDSLFQIWEDDSQLDSLRVEAYRKYIWNGFMFSNPDSAFQLSEAFILFGNEEGFPNALSQGYNLQGCSFYVKGDYAAALKFFNKALRISEENGNRIGQGSAIGNIGLIYTKQGEYSKALDYHLRSLKMSEEDFDSIGISHSLNNIGMVYTEQGENDLALDYYTQSLAIKQKFELKKDIASSFNNIGIVYWIKGDYEKSLEFLDKGLDLFREMGDRYGEAASLDQKGSVFKLQRNYTSALEFHRKSFEIHKELGNQNGLTTSYIYIGLDHYEAGSYQKSVENCKEGYQLAKSLSLLEQQKNSCVCLHGAYKKLGNSKEALVYHELLKVVEDSLKANLTTKKLQQMEFRKKVFGDSLLVAEEKRVTALTHEGELKREKLVRNGFMGGFAVVFLFAGVFFVQRNRIGKEKERSEELLLNILPGEVADELKEKGHSDAQLIDQVTVLFTDFKGFTALSEQVTPKELVADLHECFSQFDRICEKYGIEKIKTIGDAYMAAGGLPSPNTTHAEDVAKAALEMAEVVEKGKEEKKASGEPFFEIRIGVHTGPVVAGIVGVKKFQYDIWGDTVNTASRMESSGEVGKVNISEATYELLKDDNQFNFESRGKVTAKGKGEMEMYFVNLAG